MSSETQFHVGHVECFSSCLRNTDDFTEHVRASCVAEQDVIAKWERAERPMILMSFEGL